MIIDNIDYTKGIISPRKYDIDSESNHPDVVTTESRSLLKQFTETVQGHEAILLS